MSKNHLEEVIYKNLQGGYCPICNEYFKPNGTGSDSKTTANKVFKWALSQIPIDEILQREAVPVHDWRCHVGNHLNNLTFEETTSEFKNNIDKWVKIWVTEGLSWWDRRKRAFARIVLFQFADEVYSYCVGSTEAGKKAYDSNSCAVED